MGTAPTIDRATTGPFLMEGVEWVQYGHVGLVRDLETARKAAKELERLGFAFHDSKEVGRSGVFYDFVFVGNHDTPTHRLEVVTITVIAVEYSDRPQFEIVYYPKDETTDAPRRFGDTTYPGEIQVDGLAILAASEYGDVKVRPTLWP